MSYTALSASFIGAKKAIIDSLWLLVKSNFEDHQSRINALETLAAAPAGTMMDYSGAAAPSGWLQCDGSAVSQSLYADLYAAIGTTYNTGGEGVGNFRLPDPRGRASMAKGTGAGLTARTLGQGVGTETHVVLTAEMPTHNHLFTDPGHSHVIKRVNTAGGATTAHFTTNGVAVSPPQRVTNSNTTGITIPNAGSGNAHNNMQPSVAAMRVIKT